MEDPLAFFKSPEWQHPQHLISLSSYWIGWNGYYCSLLFSEDDPMRRGVLEEAIEGFSRAFIDFKENSITARSLFGRGLCYRQIGEYQRAVNDFRLAKSKINKDDSLYARCLYQESLNDYQVGNPDQALENLNKIQADIQEDKIPEEIKVNLNKLKTKILVALLKKKDEENEKEEKKAAKPDQPIFNKLKQLAMNRNNLSDFYRYAQENADRLEHMSYDELGPVAGVAIGDWFYDKKEYDKAIRHYLMIHADSSSALNDFMDRIWFRIGYIYCENKQWDKAIAFLDNFYARFPESKLVKQAASLYYLAATRNYMGNSTRSSYKKFIDSIQTYLKQCDAGPDQSEAHFQLGKYYQKTGKKQQALDEYMQVGKDSPNYVPAKYHILQSYVEKLESFGKKDRSRSSIAVKTYKDGIRLIKEYESVVLENKEAVNQKEIEPHMIMLQAIFLGFGPDKDCKRSLKNLEGFEKRFPDESKYFFKIVNLRIEYFNRLKMLKQAEAEIDRFIKPPPVDSERYAVLHDMAGRYYNEAEISLENGEKNAAARYAATALMIYVKLYAISVDNPSFKQDSDAIRLRMGQIYIIEDKPEDAILIYQDILKNNPASADAVYNLSLLYERTGQWKEALISWRTFSDGVKAGSVRWFESRYGTASALNKLGKKDRACSIITMTLVLHPDLGSDKLKQKYLDLKSEICEEGL